ncbi:MAG: hypothetical protein GXO79_09340, partial [Chlorobi bacterium]|nr:hypothetical protein [Chlorobiota bacterium]
EREKKENRKPDDYLGKPYYDYFIGNYEFSQISDFYYKDKLFKIIINGKPILWEYFESEVTKEIKAISDVIKSKYGNPTLHYELEPRYKMKKNYTYLINSWTIGEKKIEVRVLDSGTSYWVKTIIKQPKIEYKIQQEKLIKEKAETLKDKNVF